MVLKGISKKDIEIENNKFMHYNFNSYNSHYCKSGYVIISKVIKERKIKSIKINPVTKTEWKNINELDNYALNFLK